MATTEFKNVGISVEKRKSATRRGVWRGRAGTVVTAAAFVAAFAPAATASAATQNSFAQKHPGHQRRQKEVR